MFVGRDRELAFLNELHDSGRPEFFVLYGRRRVGKTELLQRFCQGHKAIYFLAAQVRPKDNLRAFRDAVRDGLGDAVVETIEFPDWPAALGYVAAGGGDERRVVVLDEFPYLCEADKGLPSQIQRFWDTVGKTSNLMLVLCGSQVSFMEKQVLAEGSPLFGRRTAQRRLEPLRPPEALPFFPNWSLDDRVLAYSILGGMPAYLRRFDDRRSLSENLAAELLRPEGYLFDEVQFLLSSELTNPATYNSILAAIAAGEQKVGDIALRVGVDSPTANKYLHVLRELRLVEREVPLSADPLRSRRGIYRITDRFLTFHFRHLQPHRGLVTAGRGERVWSEFIEPDLPRLYDEGRLDFVLDHLRREAAEVIGDEIVEVARFPGRHVRAVAKTSGDRTVAALVLSPPFDATELAQELGQAEALCGSLDEKLVYGLTDRVDRPLEIERVPEGELC